MSDCAAIIESSNGRFFNVCFLKKDGVTKRTLNGRLGVEKYLKGGQCTLDRSKYLIVYDIQAKGYRAVNRESILSVTFDGVRFVQWTVAEGDRS